MRITQAISVERAYYALQQLLLSALVLCLLAMQAEARSPVRDPVRDPMVDGARQCTRYLPQQEQHYGIPAHLLTAIAATESGRYHQQLKMPLPWPWTINVEGKGYYFDSKREAVAAVRKFQRQGIRSIDIGCMQVNLRHHPKAFASLNQAFDPRYNVAYAAKFLRENYEKDRSWRVAAGSYHSRTGPLGRKYSGKVFKNWRTILSRISRSGSVSAASKQMAYAGDSRANVVSQPAQQKRKTTKRRVAPRMKIIKVSKPRKNMSVEKSRGVKVVRPKSSSLPREEVKVQGGAAEAAVVAENPSVSSYQPVAAGREIAHTASAAPAAAPSSGGVAKRGGQFNPKMTYVNLGHVTTRTSSAVATTPSLFVFQ